MATITFPKLRKIDLEFMKSQSSIKTCRGNG